MSDFAHGAAAADIDRDGDNDLIVITNGSGGIAKVSNYFLINSGNGQLEFSEGANHLPKGLPRRVNTFLTARFADVNGDRNVDLLMAGEGKNGAPSLLLRGTGKGKFEATAELPRSTYGKRTHTTDIDTIDLNKDGLVDLLLSNSTKIDGSDFRGMQVQFLIQQDDNTFQDQTEERSWEQFGQKSGELLFPENASVSDINGDDYPDIVVQSFNPLWRDQPNDTPPHIALNDGEGNFIPVNPQWLSQEGWSWREILPIKINGQTKLIGMTLEGIDSSGGFWPIGHSVFIFR